MRDTNGPLLFLAIGLLTTLFILKSCDMHQKEESRIEMICSEAVEKYFPYDAPQLYFKENMEKRR